EVVDDAVVQAAVARSRIEREVRDVERAQHRGDRFAAPELLLLGHGYGKVAQEFACHAQSPLMPASLMILPHFALSSRMKRANSAGEFVTSSMPCAARRARSSGPPRIFTTSALMRVTMSCGVLAGTNRPSHGSSAYPGTPASAMVGVSGRLAKRCGAVLPRSFSFPSLICGSSVLAAPIHTWMRPGSRSATAGAAPL